jgi:hypothetical protein
MYSQQLEQEDGTQQLPPQPNPQLDAPSWLPMLEGVSYHRVTNEKQVRYLQMHSQTLLEVFAVFAS